MNKDEYLSYLADEAHNQRESDREVRRTVKEFAILIQYNLRMAMLKPQQIESFLQTAQLLAAELERIGEGGTPSYTRWERKDEIQ